MISKIQGPKSGRWTKAEKAENKRIQEREKVRAVYENKREVEFIPATVDNTLSANSVLKVAAYCRVSTLEDAQAGSFERQIQHFEELIDKTEGWQKVEIYADEGASGTNMKKRPQFLRMIEDCKAGKIDLIITKSVSRFARNIRDCLEVVRELKALNPPVGIIFEDINLNTNEAKNEFTLGVMSLVAQGESEQKSAAIKWSIVERFKNGVPIIPTNNLLGYDKNHLGQIVIVAEEAEVIKYIYNSYLADLSTKDIADELTKAQIPTVRGNCIWRSQAVRNILKNEKYCGDVLMQKTFTVDCFSHKKKVNHGEVPQYRLRNHHIPIIPREDWERVQELLKQPRRKSKGVKKQLEKKFRVQKIKNGKLKGFYVLDPRWRTKEIKQFFDMLSKSAGKD